MKKGTWTSLIGGCCAVVMLTSAAFAFDPGPQQSVVCKHNGNPYMTIGNGETCPVGLWFYTHGHAEQHNMTLGELIAPQTILNPDHCTFSADEGPRAG